jgi:hypothetical protein
MKSLRVRFLLVRFLLVSVSILIACGRPAPVRADEGVVGAVAAAETDGAPPEGAPAPGTAAEDTPAYADPAKVPPQWQPLGFLLGDWTGTSTGGGIRSSSFMVRLDLDGSIMTRRNIAHMDSGGTHEDMMIFYQLRDRTIRAIYFDNEHHVINYAVNPITDPVAGLTLESDDIPKQPRFRLTYTLSGSNQARIVFEIKPPGATDYQVYQEGSAVRS